MEADVGGLCDLHTRSMLELGASGTLQSGNGDFLLFNTKDLEDAKTNRRMCHQSNERLLDTFDVGCWVLGVVEERCGVVRDDDDHEGRRRNSNTYQVKYLKVSLRRGIFGGLSCKEQW